MEKLENQKCPMCLKDTCTLTEEEVDVAYFGKCYLFGMQCSSCGFSMSDIEVEENKGPIKITFETASPKDLNVRVVKSGSATVKIPTLKTTISPGGTPEGYISNIEGLLKRVKEVIEKQRDLASAENDKAAKTKAKNLLKKIWKIECGDVPVKIIIEDPSGNSAIVSNKAIVEKLKKK